MKASVLVIDADPHNGTLLAKTLKRFDFVKEARSARNAGEARRFAKEADLVLLDPLFPGIGGADFVQTFTGRKGSPGVFLIVSCCSRDMMRRYLRAGIFRSFQKPVDVWTLARAIEEWTNSRGNGVSDRETQDEQPDRPAELGAMIRDNGPMQGLGNLLRSVGARLCRGIFGGPGRPHCGACV